MATTTNFGWETPDDTDLVKDGAAAIRTALGGVDTSFVDLKGGTTGQILSKASNTDLDYTWITNDVGDITAVTAGTGISGGGTSGAVTITNSMATEIAAKGDLIVGTGAATFDNLTAGANYGFLPADSTTSTGLAWNSGGWTDYTPTITAQSGTFTSSTYYYAKYQRIGKSCVVKFAVATPNIGTGAGIRISIPFTAKADGQDLCVGSGREYQTTGNMLQIRLDGAAYDSIQLGTYSNGNPVGSGYRYSGTLVYEVA